MSKMMKCKTCGNEIAKSAKICPHCGAKQHQGVLTLCGLIIVFTVFACVFILANGMGGNPQPSDGQSEIEVSASDLWSAYSANAVNADDLYKGRLLAVSGKISDIGQDLIEKEPCISLSTGDQFGLFPVQCFFESDDSGYIASLKNGESVTIYGTCSGAPVSVVQMNNCYFESN